MRKAVVFDDFSYQCPYFEGDTDVNNGYGCTHPENEKERGEDISRCYCSYCPLGTEADEEDVTAPCGVIDWDGLCDDGELCESEYLLVNTGDDATGDQREALYAYEYHMHRYDKQWLDAHGIPNSLCR